jgi:hypothetical protein
MLYFVILHFHLGRCSSLNAGPTQPLLVGIFTFASTSFCALSGFDTVSLALQEVTMSQHSRSRNHVHKADRQRRQQPRPARRSTNTQLGYGENWVASPLLNAMDDMERHVQEMLDYHPQPGLIVPSTSTTAFDNAEIKARIMREIDGRLEEKLNGIVDTAIVARMRQLEASQRADKSCIDELQAARKRDGQTVRELDALHRHEHTLNEALVERLFDILSLEEGHSGTRFNDTTFGLKGTDSVNSVLLSQVETLVMKVQRLEQEVKWLQKAMERKADNS